MSSGFPPRRRPFDLWVWFSCTRGWLRSRIRWRVLWAHLVLLTHHALCLIALMWAILGIDSGAFCLWWTRSYGMTLHWGIVISESVFILFYRVCSLSAWCIALGHTFIGRRLFFRWPLCRGRLLSVDDGFFWVMAIPRRKSNILFHIGAWDMIDIFHLVYFT